MPKSGSYALSAAARNGRLCIMYRPVYATRTGTDETSSKASCERGPVITKIKRSIFVQMHQLAYITCAHDILEVYSFLCATRMLVASFVHYISHICCWYC